MITVVIGKESHEMNREPMQQKGKWKTSQEGGGSQINRNSTNCEQSQLHDFINSENLKSKEFLNINMSYTKFTELRSDIHLCCLICYSPN